MKGEWARIIIATMPRYAAIRQIRMTAAARRGASSRKPDVEDTGAEREHNIGKATRIVGVPFPGAYPTCLRRSIGMGNGYCTVALEGVAPGIQPIGRSRSMALAS